MSNAWMAARAARRKGLDLGAVSEKARRTGLNLIGGDGLNGEWDAGWKLIHLAAELRTESKRRA